MASGPPSSPFASSRLPVHLPGPRRRGHRRRRLAQGPPRRHHAPVERRSEQEDAKARRFGDCAEAVTDGRSHGLRPPILTLRVFASSCSSPWPSTPWAPTKKAGARTAASTSRSSRAEKRTGRREGAKIRGLCGGRHRRTKPWPPAPHPHPSRLRVSLFISLALDAVGTDEEGWR